MRFTLIDRFHRRLQSRPRESSQCNDFENQENKVGIQKLIGLGTRLYNKKDRRRDGCEPVLYSANTYDY